MPMKPHRAAMRILARASMSGSYFQGEDKDPKEDLLWELAPEGFL